MILIPPANKKFSQVNRGNILGNLWATFGIDFQENLGAIRLGKRMKIVGKTGDSGLTNLGVPTAFTAFSSKIYCIAGGRIFVGTGLHPDIVFAEDASTNARTDWSSDSDDLVNFNGTLVGFNCAQGKLYSLDAAGGTWTTRSTITGGGTNGQLLYFKKTNRLYVVSANNIHSVDTSWVVSTNGNGYDIAFTANDDGGVIQCAAVASDRIWIGMKRGLSGGSADNSNIGGTSSIYEWDGTSSTYAKDYKIPAQGTMSIVVKGDIPCILDTEGVMREYDGQGFMKVELGRLPLTENQSLLTGASPNWTQNFIHPKGMVVTKNNTILALINNRTEFDYSTGNRLYENLPSGIWEFDCKGSASMKHPLTLMPVSSTSVTDHGQNRVSLIGSLAYLKMTTTSAYGISSLFAGAEVYTDASATSDAIFMDAPSPITLSTYPEGQKYGYVVTPFFQSAQVRDMWNGVWIKLRQMLDTNDKVIVKHRYLEATALEITITWTSTTTFTTTTDLTNYVNYEVEVLQGKGSPKCSHISSVVNNSGTYTVTVDETYTGCTSGTAKAKIQNWNRTGDFTTLTQESDQFNFNDASERIQIKVCMQFTGADEIYQIAIINSTQQGYK